VPVGQCASVLSVISASFISCEFLKVWTPFEMRTSCNFEKLFRLDSRSGVRISNE